MKILMVTNNYRPKVNGVALSVERFTREYRRAGHPVLVLAPVFAGMSSREDGVVRVPAVRNFNRAGYSVSLPLSIQIWGAIDDFAPDLVHSHHPYLLGTSALRVAARLDRPIVFTYHTMVEKYTHYIPGGATLLRRFAIEVARCYANLCDRVVAPSESVAGILERRSVTRPIRVIPTGVDLFASGPDSRASFRARHGIDRGAYVVGYAGRLTREKNVLFLAHAVAAFVSRLGIGLFLVVGAGESRRAIQEVFKSRGVADRVRFAGVLEGPGLESAYRAMDVFAFASKTETQGLVLMEAMAAGLPVVALEAVGSSDLIEQRTNGLLVEQETVNAFVSAILEVRGMSPAAREAMTAAARKTVSRFSVVCCAREALSLYEEVLAEHQAAGRRGVSESGLARLLRQAWGIWTSRIRAATSSLPSRHAAR